jgi:hypothetical protein
MAIIPVAEYNRKARKRWEDAVAQSKGGLPFLPMLQFIDEKTGEPRKTGYVGTYLSGRGAIWGKTKKEVANKLKLRKVI